MARSASGTHEIESLHRAQRAAGEAKRAAEQVAEFAQGLSVVVDPAVAIEYDTLIARESAAISERVEAFEKLGLGVPSIDGTGDPEA